MLVYRICLEKWSKELKASGAGGRWNSKGRFVIYTAATRALACLENLVHRSGEGLNNKFKVLTIEIPQSIKISEVNIKNLPEGWYEFAQYNDCRCIGDEWINKNETAVLKVPSAIIPAENNFILNPSHKDFKRIKILRCDDFNFDPRIKA